MFAKLAKLGGLIAAISTTSYAEEVLETEEQTEWDPRLEDIPEEPKPPEED